MEVPNSVAADLDSVTGDMPRHIAIIMDGNNRWAKAQGLPGHEGHRAGADTVRSCIQTCAKLGVEVLTVFAFSSENWRRPADEVDGLMHLFLESLHNEVDELDAQGVQIRFIGDLSRFSDELSGKMNESVERTKHNSRLVFAVAVNYGGQWDIANAAKEIAVKVENKELKTDQINETVFAEHISLGDLPQLDLCIRTSGEFRISNFLLWQLAYAELYFTDCYWPDFTEDKLIAATDEYRNRQRRFGRTGEQVEIQTQEKNQIQEKSSSC